MRAPKGQKPGRVVGWGGELRGGRTNLYNQGQLKEKHNHPWQGQKQQKHEGGGLTEVREM